MVTTWIVIAIILLVIVIIGGLIGFVAGLSEDDKQVIRASSIVLAVGVPAAALWPLVLAAIVPGIMVYGIISAVKGLKAKSLDY